MSIYIKRTVSLVGFLFLTFSFVHGQSVQWASKVIDFSSELTPVQYAANQALGKPNVLPAGGQNPNAWTPDKPKRKEFIKLGFFGVLSQQGFYPGYFEFCILIVGKCSAAIICGGM